MKNLLVIVMSLFLFSYTFWQMLSEKDIVNIYHAVDKIDTMLLENKNIKPKDVVRIIDKIWINIKETKKSVILSVIKENYHQLKQCSLFEQRNLPLERYSENYTINAFQANEWSTVQWLSTYSHIAEDRAWKFGVYLEKINWWQYLVYAWKKYQQYDYIESFFLSEKWDLGYVAKKWEQRILVFNDKEIIPPTQWYPVILYYDWNIFYYIIYENQKSRESGATNSIVYTVNNKEIFRDTGTLNEMYMTKQWPLFWWGIVNVYWNIIAPRWHGLRPAISPDWTIYLWQSQNRLYTIKDSNYATDEIISKFYPKSYPQYMLKNETPAMLNEDYYNSTNDIFQKMYILQCEYN
jgi:hypothetical protein